MAYKIYLIIEEGKSNRIKPIFEDIESMKEFESDIYKVFNKIKIGINSKNNREFKDMMFYKYIPNTIFDKDIVHFNVLVGILKISSRDSDEYNMEVKIMVTNGNRMGEFTCAEMKKYMMKCL